MTHLTSHIGPDSDPLPADILGWYKFSYLNMSVVKTKEMTVDFGRILLIRQLRVSPTHFIIVVLPPLLAVKTIAPQG